MAKIEQKLITPSVPNFIIVESLPSKRQDGFKEGPKISIGDLPDAVLEEIANDWKNALLQRARQMRLEK